IQNSCVIGGTCYAAQSVQSGSPCHICEPTSSTTSWSNKPTGTSCDDTLYCTVSDACTAGGACTGPARDCSDALSCTIDSCNEALDTCATNGIDGCLIAGACYSANTSNSANPCQWCDPNTSKVAWTAKPLGTSCEDGLYCTTGETCNILGLCSGSARVCNDGLACTTEFCSEAQRACVPTVTTGCLIGGSCIASGTQDPSNQCKSCIPLASTTAYSNKLLGTSCNDGQFCTVLDGCDLSGQCTGVARVCEDGLLCTTDSCDENADACVATVSSGCVIGGTCRTAGANDPSNECRYCNPGTSSSSWTNRGTNVSCNDGVSCTDNDLCNGSGACAGAAHVCDDGLWCTTEVCTEPFGACSPTIATGCLIGGVCYADGAVNPSNPCQVCNAASSRIVWTNRPSGTTCDDSLFCTVGETCNVLGLCAGPARNCSDNLDCTLDLCDENADVCTSTTAGCVIDGQCVSALATNPANSCQWCNPGVSSSSWTAKAVGASCNDGQFCTVTDVCNASAQCNGTPRSCNDNVACSTDSCDEVNDTCVANFAGGCVIGGSCVAGGDHDPLNNCRVCDTQLSTTSWSTRTNGESCNDGQYCTVGETCNALGLCMGPARVCNDGLNCTSELCVEALQTCVPTVTTGCLIGGVCVATGVDDPTNQCKSCIPLASTTAYSNKLLGTSCNDGLFCTAIDACDLTGQCSGLPRVCEDGLLCTTDSCDESADACTATIASGCVIGNVCYPDGFSDLGNFCRACSAGISTTSWTNKGTNVSCSDGVSCTDNDLCNGAGACAGTPHVCNDGLTCTTEVCTEPLGLCSPTVATGCLIGGVCYAEGDIDPTNLCHICDPASSRLTWTNRPIGTTCDDGQFCTVGETCSILGLCIGPARDCSDNLDCTLDLCDDFADTCVSSTLGCVIDGQCVSLAANDPTNSCRYCNPVLSGTSWTPKAAGTVCNDGQFCTVLDACSPEGLCTGSARSCNDNVACSTDSCNEVQDSCVASFAGGCVIGGSCVAGGDDDPLNSCRVCNPAQSTTSWTTHVAGEACDDGLFCTDGESCNALGLCLGPARVCNDGLDCTSELCIEALRQCVPTVTSGCVIGGTCITSGTQDPAHQCRACQPLVSSSAYSNKLLGTPCDDGAFCTAVDACDLTGECAGIARVCEDGLLCTTDACDENSDTCVATIASGCVIDDLCYADGSGDPSNFCRVCDAQTSNTSWTNKGTNVACNDGFACTDNDACGGGACAGTPRVCNDGLTCTTEVCSEPLGLCVPTIASGCLIAGACYADGDPDPSNPCHVCSPASSRITWTHRPVGTTCDDQQFCTTGETCNLLGLCVGTARNCADSLDCTIDLCDENANLCVSTPAGCVIDGQCVAALATHPTNSCLQCNPLASTSAWSAKAAGALCDDGQFCTILDTCDASAACSGTPRTCNDLVACSTDSCDEAQDACTATFAGGCVIAGSCVAGGDHDPLNNCNVCEPASSRTNWTTRTAGELCDDGLYCTSGEACSALGLCLGSARVCNDGLDCTNELCVELLQACVPTITDGCVIDGACVDAGDEDPTSECRACNPVLSTSAYSNKLLGTPCNDGAFCTAVDACDLTGQCAGVPRLCEDGLLCTNDSCDEAADTCVASVASGCLIDGTCYPDGFDDLGNFCRSCEAAVSNTSWTNKDSSTACNDGLACTDADACNGAGACAGTPHVCNDGLSCTTELCTEPLGLCAPTIASGCLIGGVCYADGDEDPSNPCHVCDGASSRVLWTNRPVGSACEDGLFCTTSETCSLLGVCLGPPRSCADALDCTVDICDEAGDRCVSTPAGCVIDGQCVLPYATHPTDSCRQCDPLVSTSSWTAKAAGAACDDGQFCTVVDVCDVSAACSGTPRTCNDLVACSTDSCDESQDACVASFAGGCVIGGSCVADGDHQPLVPCNVCDAAQSTTAWTTHRTGEPCDDEQYCTDGETCNALGLCLGPARDCDDGLGCTSDVCVELLQACVPTVTDGCVIDGACVAAGTQDPDSQCRACTPLASTSDYSNKLVGTPCDDGAFCTTVDACDLAGECAGLARVCEDGLLCTADSCDEGTDTCVATITSGCVIDDTCYPDGFDDVTNFCRSCNAGTSNTTWTNKGTSVSCNDGLACTDSDVCDGAGACAGSPHVCDDGLGCTSEVCAEPLGLCVPAITSGCLIAGVCYAEGDPDPTNSCHVCDAASSAITWTNRPIGTACVDTLFCTVSETCNLLGLCAGPLRNCADNLDCTVDLCDEAGDVCTSTPAGCVIDGQCVLPGATHPTDSCRQCNPLVSTSSWTAKPAGALCDDGLFCTIVDVCDASAACSGTPRPCDDLVACSTDSCNEAQDTCVASFSGGCVIAGSCVADGDTLALSPCSICDTAVSTTSWTTHVNGEPCDDGLFCTDGESCNALGLCLGAGHVCDDGLGCTSELCVEALQACVPTVTDGCVIDGACVATGTEAPDNQCRVCNPLLSTSDYSNQLLGTPCDDGAFCTAVDACDLAGDCSGLPRVCEDGLLCTADSCDEGSDACVATVTSGCVIDDTCYPDGFDDLTNSCRTCDAGASNSGWTNKSSSSSCNDGLACTDNDACDGAGGCAGTPHVCSDALDCTSEVCSEPLGLCIPSIANGCLIAGVCYADGDPDPGNPCHVCNSAASPILWTNRAVGTACDDGLFCTSVDTCNVLGLCSGPLRSCDDNLGCTVDLCNEAADTCTSTPAGCVIDGQCVLPGATHPTDSCRECNPLVSNTDWTAKPVGASCDDGLFCTILEVCDASAACGGTARSCDDLVACSTDTCDEAQNTCTASFAGGCVIAGSCVADGGTLPLAPCSVCDTAVSTTAWTVHVNGESCDDGLFCTAGETCNGLGLCLGPGRVCDDGLGCTSELCVEALQACVPTVTDGCVIDNTCVAAGTEDPDRPCRACNPLLSTADYSNKLLGTPCDDGLFCTAVDACDLTGQCAGLPRVCEDGLLCTTDNCDEGADVCVATISAGCVIDDTCYPDGFDDLTNSCRTCDAAAFNTGWTNKGTSSSCNDGLACTDNDACNGAGGCTGMPHGCNDGLDCTTDTCTEPLGLCIPSIASGCLIAGVCYADGDPDPENPCHVCDSAASPVLWTNRSLGTPCTDGLFCTIDETCNLLGLCTGPLRSCDDSLACTVDICDDVVDACVSTPAGCVIDGQCVLPGATHPTDSCRVCNPLVSTSSWTAKPAGALCDDGLFCTILDVCDTSAACSGTTRSCDDVVACSTDSCDETQNACVNTFAGGCVIAGSCIADGDSMALSPCSVCDTAVSTTSWTTHVNGETCNDGLFCTDGESCNALGLCLGAPHVCDDGLGCTAELCVEVLQACVPTITDGCVIDNSCVATGTDDPGNQCRECNPLLSTAAYTNKLLGTPCDDEAFCTALDACDLTGQCAGLPRVCEDGLLCTSDACDEGADACVATISSGCVIDNTCYPDGFDDLTNSCRTCDAATSNTGWTNKGTSNSCNDGLACTDNDACDGAGGCAGVPHACSDGLDCTSELCTEPLGLCVPNIASGCLIAGVCYADGDPDPDNPCHVCDAATSQILWSNRPVGTPCTDALFCTVTETCNLLGLCSGPLRSCDDNLPCTVDLCDELGDVCTSTPAGCVIDGQCVLPGATHPTDSCRECNPLVSTASWTAKPAGALCDDGLFCTILDVCDASAACSGTARSCDDLAACSTDTCNEAQDVCVNSFAGGCVIAGSCVADGDTLPLNPCSVCDSAVSTTSWTTHTGGETCDDGLFCTDGETCNALGLCLGAAHVCDDSLGCTTELCVEALQTCVPAITDGCVIDNTCVAAGTQDPGNQCRECNPLLSTSDYSDKLLGTPCDDGAFCTAIDACDLTGACAGIPRVCEDGLLCTADSCDEGADACVASISSGCVIDNLCYPDGFDDLTNACRTCDAAASDTNWTNKGSNAGCNDGLACTDNDACDGAGGCAGTPVVCDD
ncbi:MAG: hypothetical protein ABW321_23115, partial [Polyangiales bacterium]